MTSAPDPPFSFKDPKLAAATDSPSGSSPKTGPGAGRGLLPLFKAHWAVTSASLCLVLAVLLPWQVYPRMARLPADPQATAVLQSSDATVLLPDPDSSAGVGVVRGTNVSINTFVSAAAGESDGRSVVWNLASTVMVEGHGLLSARVERVSLDPRTAEPTNCCGDRLMTEQDDPVGDPITHYGLIAWPFDVQAQPYEMWDVQTRRTRTATFLGEENRDGVRTYRFEVSTPLEKVGTQELPGRLFGVDEASVVADSEFESDRTMWVEPATGAVIRIHERLKQQFRYDDRVVPAMSGSFNSAPMDRSALAQIRVGAVALPWLRGRASLLLFACGLALLFLAARRMRRAPAVAVTWTPRPGPRRAIDPQWRSRKPVPRLELPSRR
jgi:hypothetical protein